MTKHYFVDYDVYSFGQVLTFGQFSLSWEFSDNFGSSPEKLISHMRERAAALHGVDEHEIRVRSLTKL